jgi:2'-5' RNA ligase
MPGASRPTHFLALQLPDPALHAGIASLQSACAEREPSLKACAVSPAKTHLTLFVFDGNGDRLARALAAFEGFRSSFVVPAEPPRIRLSGLDTFGPNVLYCSIEADDAMAQLGELRQRAAACFVSHGLLDEQCLHESWSPHVTVLKTSAAGRRAGKLRIRRDAYAGLDGALGTHALPHVSLCQMGGEGEGRFYPVLARAPLWRGGADAAVYAAVPGAAERGAAECTWTSRRWW